MSTEDAPKSAKTSKEEFDIIQNRIQLALAKRENLIKSWTAKSSRKEPTKTEAELDAEDAALFRNEPPYLGVGAPIPSHFLVSDAERNNKSLRAKFFPGKGLKGSKPRDSEEKAASAKRALNEESSDEEGGRSSLGKAKKLKTTKATPAHIDEIKDTKAKTADDDIDTGDKEQGKLGATKEGEVEASLATPPETPEKNATANTSTSTNINEDKAKESIEQTEESGRATNQTEVPQVQKEEQKEQEAPPAKPINAREIKLQKVRENRKLKRKVLKARKEQELIARLAVNTLEWLDKVQAEVDAGESLGNQVSA